MNKSFHSLLSVGAVTFGALFTAATNAAPVTYDFGGALAFRYDAAAAPAGYMLPSYLQLGAPFVGSITFDVDGVADSAPLETVGFYTGVIKSFSVNIAGYSWTLTTTPDSVTYESVTDNYVVASAPPGFPPIDGIFLNTFDSFGAFALPNDPATVWVGLSAGTSNTSVLSSIGAISDLSVFQVNQWRLNFNVAASPEGGQSYSNAWGFLTGLSLRPSEVPVPAAAWMFGSGILGLIGVVRRRRLVA